MRKALAKKSDEQEVTQRAVNEANRKLDDAMLERMRIEIENETLRADLENHITREVENKQTLAAAISREERWIDRYDASVGRMEHKIDSLIKSNESLHQQIKRLEEDRRCNGVRLEVGANCQNHVFKKYFDIKYSP